MVKAMEHSNADILTCFADTFWSKDAGNPDAGAIKRIVYFGADVVAGLYRNPYGDSNCLVRRSAFDTLGGFTEDYMIGRDDQEFFSRAALSNVTLYVIPEALYWYRLSKKRMSHNQFSHYAGMQRVLSSYLRHPGLPAGYAEILRYSQGLAAARLGVIGSIASQLSRNRHLRNLVQRFPFIYRYLGGLHKRIF